MRESKSPWSLSIVIIATRVRSYIYALSDMSRGSSHAAPICFTASFVLSLVLALFVQLHHVPKERFFQKLQRTDFIDNKGAGIQITDPASQTLSQRLEESSGKFDVGGFGIKARNVYIWAVFPPVIVRYTHIARYIFSGNLRL